jgi:hypothetical protein
MYKQGGEVQLEQWDIYLWLNTTYNAVHGWTLANVNETVKIIQKPHTEIGEI